jgi:hypothetical protein
MHNIFWKGDIAKLPFVCGLHCMDFMKNNLIFI